MLNSPHRETAHLSERQSNAIANSQGTTACSAARLRDGGRRLQLDRAADEAGERARVSRGVLVEEAVARAALHVVVERVEAACAERR